RQPVAVAVAGAVREGARRDRRARGVRRSAVGGPAVRQWPLRLGRRRVEQGCAAAGADRRLGGARLGGARGPAGRGARGDRQPAQAAAGIGGSTESAGRSSACCAGRRWRRRRALGRGDRMSRFFIDRPIFAAVLSIIIVLAGLVASQVLPVAQYPEIAPPTVTISTSYPGASAETLA